MNNADLLEKLDTIKEAIRRNPDEWWRDLEYYDNREYVKSWITPSFADDIFEVLMGGAEIRLKPQCVKVEGEVSTTTIDQASIVMGRFDKGSNPYEVAQALLQLVKRKGDGKV